MMRTSWPRAASAAALIVALAATALVGGASTASAGGVGGNGGASGSAGTETADVPRCRMYGSDRGFGVACTGPGGSGGSLRSLLSGPLPECWHEGPPEGFRPPARQGGGEGRWWLRTCMTGVDRTTLAPTGSGGISLTYGYDFLPPGEARELTEGEQTVIDALVARGQVPIPFPMVETYPSASPRVGETVSFALSNETTTRSISIDGITMQARVVGLRVEPEGVGGPVLQCDGAGRELTAEQVDDGATQAPDVCAYTFDRSSFQAGEQSGRDRYPAAVTALWEVQYSSDRGSGTLGPFEKRAFTEVRVAEVQTLVVS